MSDPSNEGNVNDPGHDPILTYQKEIKPRSRMRDWLMACLIIMGLIILIVGVCFAAVIFS